MPTRIRIQILKITRNQVIILHHVLHLILHLLNLPLLFLHLSFFFKESLDHNGGLFPLLILLVLLVLYIHFPVVVVELKESIHEIGLLQDKGLLGEKELDFLFGDFGDEGGC